MAFELTPAAPVPSKGRDGFPDYLQFQADGVNLGGRDADTLNFGAGLTKTRGTGATANVVTLSADASPGGGAQTLAVWLQGDAAASKFNRDFYSDWSGTVICSSTDAAWNNTTKVVDVTTPGLYEFKVRGTAQPDPNGTGNWPGQGTVYGTNISPDEFSDQPSMYSRASDQYPGSSGNEEMIWSDVFLIPIGNPQSVTIGMYAEAYDSLRETPVLFYADLSVTRIGDYIAPA